MQLLEYAVRVPFGLLLGAFMLSFVATVGIALLGIAAAVLWMCFVHLMVERLAARRHGGDRRVV